MRCAWTNELIDSYRKLAANKMGSMFRLAKLTCGSIGQQINGRFQSMVGVNMVKYRLLHHAIPGLASVRCFSSWAA
ncbi:hypothetical protein FXE14_13725 [Lactobacillus sp. LSI2-1]|nr:hypothetical protein [Lactiplantibacillus plantarum]QFY65593.1 hypothetical protein CEB40_07935 [Lactiplantibacillus plantarum]TYA17457.1 hypothetical protein FXE14_13725 [Lactobacillus sp. LSI2-1]